MACDACHSACEQQYAELILRSAYVHLTTDETGDGDDRPVS